MANNQYVNKVIYGGNVIIDLTDDDITPADVQNGKKFHLKDGSTTTGTNNWDSNTQDANATAAEILSGQTAYVNKNKITGEMPNRGAQVISITSASTSVIINNGYHDGSGYAQIDSVELTKLIPDNIRENVVILGVSGTMSGSEDVHATTSIVTPSTTTQIITPPTNYNYFTQYIVNAIPRVDIDNIQGGITVTIAGN